jgi:hypothetical protein
VFELVGFAARIGEQARGVAEPGGVNRLDSSVEVGDADQSQHGSEDLFASDGHVRFHLAEDDRTEEIALAVRSVLATVVKDVCSLFDSRLDVVSHARFVIGSDERPNSRVFGEAVTDDCGLGLFDDGLGERVVGGVLDYCDVEGQTALT